MKTIKEVKVALVEDRNILKWKVQLVKEGRVFGFIRPAEMGK